MSISFVIGRAGSGKTHRCFSRIVEALRGEPLGPPIYWILPRQATFVSERRLTCAAGLEGFCRARVLSFEQLGQEIFADCGGSAVPEVTAIGRQMILGHLLRRHASKLVFFKSIERQAGLAAELDATFDELERAGKNAADLSALLDELTHSGPLDIEGESLRAKLHDVRLLYDAYIAYLGQDRLDQHRRLKQVLESVQSCSFLPKAMFYVDGFFEFTDHERRMLGAIAKAGANMEITLLMDPSSPLLNNPHPMPGEMGLFHRTETTYRRLWFTFSEENITIAPPVLLGVSRRFDSTVLARVEREMFSPGPAPILQNLRDTGVPPVLGSSTRAKGGDKEEILDSSRPRHGQDAHVTSEFSIQRVEAPDRAAEVDAVARRVSALLAGGYRLRDIAVLVRGLEKYHAPIAASFDEHDIPYFVDRRRTAAHHPLLQLLRCAMQAARSDWNHDAVVALMKTGLAGLSLDEADELENYCLLHRVRGSAWESPQPWAWRRDLLRHDDQAEAPASANPLLIDALRQRIAGALGPLVKLMAPGTAIPLRKIAAEIFAMFERLGVRQTLAGWMSVAGPAAPDSRAGASRDNEDVASQLEARGEHEQVWVKLSELFDQMVDLLGDERVTPTDFVDIVESALERLDLGITPPTVDQVLVGQADRTRCPPVKAVFVLGLNEAEFPAVPLETTVLSDRERRELGRRKLDLDPDCRRRLLDERLLGYAAFTQPSQRLILCRPQGDDAGRPVAPSAFWERIGEMFPGVPTEQVPRAHTGDASQIATPRQLIAGLMGWVRRSPGGAGILPVSNRELSNRDDRPDNSWPLLYQWLVSHGTDNPFVDRLCRRAWPALTYANDAALSPDAPALFTLPLSIKTAQLETMAVCPFQHFARYGLKLSQRQRAEVSGGDLGLVYHQLLERLVSQAIRQNPGGPSDPFAISADSIHAAAMKVARTLRGELLLSTARNRYMLQRIERTLAEVIASQKAMMEHTRYRPAYTGKSFGEYPNMRSVPVTTPRGKRVLVRGSIDRIDTVEGTGDAIVVDYKLGNSFLALDRVYYGLSLQLLTSLLALQGGAEDLDGHSMTPTGAFYLGLLRSLEDVKHPEKAPNPAEAEYLLKNKPRGLFDARASADLDTSFDRGRSKVVSMMVKKDGTAGDRNRTDVIDSVAFRALLAHVQRRIGELADQIITGNVAIAPFRLNRYSPCKTCEFRGVCRFETSVNRYHHLVQLKREEVMEKVRQEAADEK